MKTKRLQKMLSAVLALTMCFCMMIPVFAAAASRGGNSGKAVTFTVTTGSSSEKLKFTQKKGVLGYNNLVSAPKTMNAYDCFTIKYQKIDNKACYLPQTATMDGGSLSIKLEKNTTYHITVTPATLSTLQQKNGGFLGLTKYVTGWKSYATWSVTGSSSLRWSA